MSAMKITLRTFHREFGRMRRLASKGVAIHVQARRETFVFAKEKPVHGLLGCCVGLMDSSRLTTAPIGEAWEAQK